MQTTQLGKRVSNAATRFRLGTYRYSSLRCFPVWFCLFTLQLLSEFYLSTEIEPNEQQAHGLYNLKQRQWEWEGERERTGERRGTVYVITRETCSLRMWTTINNAKLFAIFGLHCHCWKFCHDLHHSCGFNLYDFLSSMEHEKFTYFEEGFNCFCPHNQSQLGPKLC